LDTLLSYALKLVVEHLGHQWTACCMISVTVVETNCFLPWSITWISIVNLWTGEGEVL